MSTDDEWERAWEERWKAHGRREEARLQRVRSDEASQAIIASVARVELLPNDVERVVAAVRARQVVPIPKWPL